MVEYWKPKTYYSTIMGLREFLIGLSFGVGATLLFTYYEMLVHKLHFSVNVALGLTLVLYLIPPVLMYSNCYVRRHLIFLPFVLRPFWINFDDTKSQGLKGTRNFYLESEPGIRIGIWHMLPKCLFEESEGKDGSYWEESLSKSGKPVIVYLHGTSASRALWHRKELYHLLQDMDIHVIALDYRGYADSSRVEPYETGVVADSTCVYKWVLNQIGDKREKIPLYVWGHSLGTGVSCHMVAKLTQENLAPHGLFLECPFSNLGDQFKYHWLSTIYRWIPGFLHHVAVKPLEKSDIAFKSHKHIANITCPILIMHAVDDLVVPYFLGQKLYRSAVRTRPVTAHPIFFKRFDKKYEHRYICRSPEIPQLVSNFMQCAFVGEYNCDNLRIHSTEWASKAKRRDPSRVVISDKSLPRRFEAPRYY